MKRKMLILSLITSVTLACAGCGNRQIIDTTYTYEKAIIYFECECGGIGYKCTDTRCCHLLCVHYGRHAGDNACIGDGFDDIHGLFLLFSKGYGVCYVAGGDEPLPYGYLIFARAAKSPSRVALYFSSFARSPSTTAAGAFATKPSFASFFSILSIS